jgi:hypothetical protein
MAAANADQVSVVNHMDLSDALRIAHFLHTQLTFVTTADGIGIQPYPLPSDIVDGCTFGGQVNSMEFGSDLPETGFSVEVTLDSRTPEPAPQNWYRG